MKFRYHARTKQGKTQEGTVDASNREGALNVLQKYGLYITSLEAIEKPAVYARKIKIFKEASKKDLSVFSRQLAIMFKAGVSLVETIETLASQTKKDGFKEKLFRIAEDVEGGMVFSQALERYPKIFDSFYISMVKSGEASGKLAESLSYLAEHLEREYFLRSKILGALFYPAFILFVFLVIGIIVVVFIIPQLSEVLKSAGRDLPWITKLVLSVADFLRTKGWVALIFIVGLVAGLVYYLKSKKGKKVINTLSLKIPFLNVLLKKIYLSRFAENLSTLISGSLSIAKALEISGEIVGNQVYKSAIFHVRDEVQRGSPPSEVLRQYPKLFPPVFIQMTMVGEKTGKLDSALLNVVSFYREEVTRSLEKFVQMLEPLLIVFLGVIVAGLVASVLMPLYSFGGP